MSSNDESTRAGRKFSKKPGSGLDFKVGKNYLLVIGIDKYSNGIPRLNNAVSDAQLFKNALVERYQFEEGAPYTIELYDEEATRGNIIQTFDQLILTLKKEDSLVFYFSGHGEYLKHVKTGYWVPVDAINEKRYTYLTNNTVLNMIDNIKARHVFGVIDSCFSGSLFRSMDKKKVTQRYFSKPSRMIITSGQLEVVADGALGDQSPFAKKLLSQLDNNIRNSLRVSTLCEGVLDDFEFDDTRQVPQWGPLMNVGHGNGQFVFFKKDADWTALVEEEVATQSTTGGIDRHIDRQTGAGTGEVSRTVTPEPELPAEIPNTLDEFKLHLEMMIAAGDIPGAFDAMKTRVTNTSYRTTLFVRYGEYNGNKKKEASGIADARDLKTSYAQIRHTFLSLVQRLTERDVNLSG